MANRRMFSLDIVDSDAFVDLPLTAQALYFHLGMRADDDGFISSPRKVLRMVRAGEDDMKILIGKRFVMEMPEGICVIKHWKMNNYIQKDRYKPTVYQDQLGLLETKENGSYTENDALCIQDVSKVETQDRLGKVRIDNTMIKNSFDRFWKVYPKKVGKAVCMRKWKSIKPSDELANKIIAAVEQYQKTDQWQRDNGQYIPHPATFLNQRRWEDEISTAATGNGWHKSYD